MEIVTGGTERRNLMSNWNGKERRKYPRYPFSADVLLRLHDNSGNLLIQYQGYCKNISLKGICVKSDPKCWKIHDNSGNLLIQYQSYCKNISPKGSCIKPDPECWKIKEKTKLQVKISVWSAEQGLELTGQVAWCSQDEKDSKIGIQFLSNNNKGKEVLLFQLVEDVRKKASSVQNNVRIIRNADLARGKVVC